MLTELPDVLDADELGALRQAMAEGEYADGRRTAGNRARRVKHNQQLSKRGKDGKNLDDLVLDALWRHSVLRMAAVPKRIQPPLFSCYSKGMRYGQHVDDALMTRAGASVRTDLALTLFLSEPDSYDGGQLLVQTPYGQVEVKLPMGHAILYPASTLHEVRPVTRGERWAAVTWLESHVRDPARREVLFDLDAIKIALSHHRPEAPETELAHKTYSNLLRLWAET
jgi:PKHD-type hydroxylase